MATDPYSQIQQMQFNVRGPATYEEYINSLIDADPVSGGGAAYHNRMSPEEYAASIAGAGRSVDATNPFASNLGAFQSKYNQNFTEVPGMPGVYKATLQNPGMHKYDTLDALYRIDPETGQGTLLQPPTPSRQTSSRDNLQDALEKGAITVGGAALGAYGLGCGTFGLSGGLGAAAGGAAQGAGFSAAMGGDKQSVLRGAVLGGLGGYGQYAFSGAPAAGANPGGMSDSAVAAMSDAEFARYLDTISTPTSGAASAASSLPAAAGQTINITGALPSAGIGGLAGAVGAIPSPVAASMPEVSQQLDQIEIKAPKQPQPALGGLAGIPPVYATPVGSPGTPSTIEVIGKRPPIDDSFPAASIPPVLGTTGVTTPPLGPSIQGAANPLPEMQPGGQAPAGNGIMDFFNKNPKLALTLLSSLAGKGGGGGGGGGPAGPGTSIDQTQLTATPAQKFQRQYVPPPPGYRPGFDPEHKYFTGIGTVGTGG